MGRWGCAWDCGGRFGHRGLEVHNGRDRGPQQIAVNLVCYKHCSHRTQEGSTLKPIHTEPKAAPWAHPQGAKEKMEQLEGALQSAEPGQGLCSSQRLQKQHHQLEGKSQALASRMAVLAAQAHLLADSQAITEETQKCLQRYPLVPS